MEGLDHVHVAEVQAMRHFNDPTLRRQKRLTEGNSSVLASAGAWADQTGAAVGLGDPACARAGDQDSSGRLGRGGRCDPKREACSEAMEAKVREATFGMSARWSG